MANARAIDPTRTGVLRNRGAQHYRAMWQRIERRVMAYIDTIDYSRPLPQRTIEFSRFLDDVLRSEFGATNSDRQRGINALILTAYLRGVRDADSELGEEFNRYDVYREDHSDVIAALLLLLATQLTQAQANVQSQILERYGKANDAQEAKAAIRDRLRKIGRTVTNGIIATIIVRAFNDALLVEYQRHGIKFVGVEDEHVFWQTMEDGRVCKQCHFHSRAEDRGFGPGIFTIQHAMGFIPLHTNCRCRWRAIKLPNGRSAGTVISGGTGRFAPWSVPVEIGPMK